MINKIFAKIFAITSFFNPLNYISNKSYPNIKEPQVIEPYKSACYGRRPQRQTLQIQRQSPPKLERGRTPSQKRSLCVTALINTPLYPLPPICLADNYTDLRNVLTGCLKDLNSSKKKQSPNVTKVTSKQLEDWMCQSPDLDVKRMVALYKGDGIRRLSKGWFELNDSPFFVAKQMSTWAGPNSAAHNYFLRLLSFNKKNFLKWQTHLFRQRPSATIQTFAFGPPFTPRQDSIRISYELAINFDKPTSSDVQSGKSGSNQFFPNIDFFTYCLVIEYAKIPNQNLLSKIGTPISGFIRESKYSPEMEKCLLNPSQDGMPWGGLKSNLTLFQSNFTRLRKPGRMKQTVLPKHLDPAVLARKLFGRLSRAVTWKNNGFMQKDYT